jgi:hypothetical protein
VQRGYYPVTICFTSRTWVLLVVRAARTAEQSFQGLALVVTGFPEFHLLLCIHCRYSNAARSKLKSPLYFDGVRAAPAGVGDGGKLYESSPADTGEHSCPLAALLFAALAETLSRITAILNDRRRAATRLFVSKSMLACLFLLLIHSPAAGTDINLGSSHNGMQVTGSAASRVTLRQAVSAAGDVNGDGYSDLLLAALYDTTGAAVYITLVTVLFGSPSFGVDSVAVRNPSQSLETSINIFSGSSTLAALGPAGDFNMDGIDDFLVGDAFNDPFSRKDAGAVAVIFGKTSGWSDTNLTSFSSGSAGLWVYGGAAGDKFGQYGSAAGDVNGDGAGDIVVSSTYTKRPKSSSGGTYVIFGHSAATAPFADIDLANFTSSAVGFRISGWQRSLTKLYVTSAGDFNHDGYSDVLVGAHELGASYLLFGHSPATDFTEIHVRTMAATEGFVITGGPEGYCLVSSAGDFNHDGVADILLGCPNASPRSQTSAGTAFILFGSNATAFPGMIFPDVALSTFKSGTAGLVVQGRRTNDLLGGSVSGGADINGDGTDDVVIGSFTAQANRYKSAAILLLGRAAASFSTINLASPLPDELGFKILCYSSAATAGMRVALLKSFDGDGFADVATGSVVGTTSRVDVVYGAENSFPTAMPTVFSCFPGTHYLNESAQHICIDCPPGHFSDAKGLPTCTPCLAGWEAPSARSAECVICQPGYFTVSDGTAQCSACPSGSYSAGPGGTGCTLAPVGASTNGEGDSRFHVCPIGTYIPAPGYNTSCLHCPNARVTAKPGSTNLSDCFLPHTNFLFAPLSLMLALFVSAAYILAGRVHSIAYGRMRFIREAKEQYQWLIESVQRLEQTRDESTQRAVIGSTGTLWRWMRPVAWVAAEIAVLVYGVISASLFVLGKVFFFAMVIWRNIHFQFPHLNFMDQIASALAGIGDVVGPTLLAVVSAIASACNWFATIPVDLSVAEVTCKGSSAPITLLIDVCIFVRVICLVDCDIAVFLQTTFGDAHETFRRALTLPHLEALLPYDFRTKVWLWLCSYVESSVLSPSVVVTVLQLLLGFVSIGEFFVHGGMPGYTAGCNAVQFVTDYDKATAVITSCVCYYLVIPAAYTVLKFLVPRLPVRRAMHMNISVEETVAVEAQIALSVLRTGQRARALDGWFADSLGQQAAACKDASACARALAAARRLHDEHSQGTEQLGDVLTATPAAQDEFKEAEAHVKVARGYLSALQAQLAGGFCRVYEADIQAAEDEVQHAEARSAAARSVRGGTRRRPNKATLATRTSYVDTGEGSNLGDTAPTTPYPPTPAAPGADAILATPPESPMPPFASPEGHHQGETSPPSGNSEQPQAEETNGRITTQLVPPAFPLPGPPRGCSPGDVTTAPPSPSPRSPTHPAAGADAGLETAEVSLTVLPEVGSPGDTTPSTRYGPSLQTAGTGIAADTSQNSSLDSLPFPPLSSNYEGAAPPIPCPPSVPDRAATASGPQVSVDPQQVVQGSPEPSLPGPPHQGVEMEASNYRISAASDVDSVPSDDSELDDIVVEIGPGLSPAAVGAVELGPLSYPVATCDPNPRGTITCEALPVPTTPLAVMQRLREAERRYRVAVRNAERAMGEAGELAEATVAAAKDAEEGLQQMSKLQFYTAQDIDGLYSRALESNTAAWILGPFTDSVRPLVSLLQPDDSWLSWRFRWAFKTLNVRTPSDSQAFVFPLSAELRRSLHRPRRMGPILYMPWNAVPEDEVESQRLHQMDWNAERFNRLPPCGFLPVVTCYTHRAVLLANLRTIMEIYLCGIWNNDSVAMLGLRDLLDSCGVDSEATNHLRRDSVTTSLYRLVTCDFATKRKVKRGGSGDSGRMAVSSILYAKLVPRVTLCLLFPYGAFVAAFVNNTVAYPLWCHSPYLNDRLPRILVFEAWALAEERVAEGGNRVYWKVLLTAINIFVMESRLIGYLFGLLQYLMTLAVLFFPSRGFLAFGTVLIGIYSLCSSLHLMVSVAHIFEISEIKVHPHDSADPADDATDVEAPGDQHGARLLAAVKDIRAHTPSQVAAPKPFSTCATCGAVSAHGEACVCSKTQPPTAGR